MLDLNDIVVQVAKAEGVDGGRTMEQFVVNYFVSMLQEAIELEVLFDQDEDIVDYLISYDICTDETHAKVFCKLLQSKVSKHLSPRPSREDHAENILQAPIRIADTSEDYKASRERKSKKDYDSGFIEPAKAKTMDKDELPQIRRKIFKDQTFATGAVVVSGTGMGPGSRNINLIGFNLIPLGGGDDLLLNCDLKLAEGRKYGLIGRNGTGKSTLLRNVSRRMLKGIPEALKIVHVEQEMEGTDQTILEAVLASDPVLDGLLKKEKELMQNDPESDLLKEIHEKLTTIDAWSAESRACTILSGLQFEDAEMSSKTTKELSGGWRMRVALASALFASPDLLLLDEPTNHLDFPAVVWLEGYLKEVYQGTLVLVSHDRYFVNNVVTDIMHLYERKLTYYKGDYDSFEKTRNELRKQQSKAFEAQERKRKHVQSFIDRFRFNAKRASLVQSRIKTLEKFEASEDFIMDLQEDPEFKFEFPTPEILQKEIVDVRNADFGYTPEKQLLSQLSLRVDMNSRIGILGVNGSGKSTLVKLMNGELEPTNASGFVFRNRKARVSTFAQHHIDSMELDLSAFEFLQKKFPSGKPLELRGHLGKFGVSGELAMRSIGTLSGGQKSRVAFAVATFSNPHLLILDEPTNHCDLETVEALIFAIGCYDGGIVAVSHDQHFLTSIGQEFWVVLDKKITICDSFEKAKKKTYKSLAERK